MLSLEELMEIASSYDGVEEAMEQAQTTRPHYFRKVLHERADMNVVLVCFDECQATSLHSHGDANCVVRCLEGRAFEVQYYRNHDKAFTPMRTRMIVKGDVIGVYFEDWHQVTNFGRGRTVLLNFYSLAKPREKTAGPT
jgi:quercetin dioxygenase-like cupin family protein